MRHRKAGRKFGRNTSHRKAMFRNLAGNLVLHERIRTTDAKAKELRRIVERLVTRATRLGDDLTADLGKDKNDDERAKLTEKRMSAKRLVAKYLPHRLDKTNGPNDIDEKVDLVHKLFSDIAPRFLGRPGGYTRIVKLPNRRGDNAPMSVIEFIDYKAPEKEVVSEEDTE